jgi:prephenate dehydrogenase
MYNDEILNVHKHFLNSSKTFSEFVEKNDEESFVKNIKSSAKFFGNNAEKGQIYTDKIIFML